MVIYNEYIWLHIYIYICDGHIYISIYVHGVNSVCVCVCIYICVSMEKVLAQTFQGGDKESLYNGRTGGCMQSIHTTAMPKQ